MKYIRTKDGRIIDLKNWSSIETICVNAETNEAKKDICYQRSWLEYHEHGDACQYKTEYISHNSQVLDQADTVKDLCDCFVDHNLEQDTCLVTHDYKLRYNHEVYGAIWVFDSNGAPTLKPVAKMIEKKGLVLL